MKILVMYTQNKDIALVLGCAENSGTLMNHLTERYDDVAENEKVYFGIEEVRKVEGYTL